MFIDQRATKRLSHVRSRADGRIILSVVGALVLVVTGGAWPAFSQELTRFDRDQARMMLKTTRDDLVKYYYDPAFHGLDLDKTFNAAEEAIVRARSHADLFLAVATTLLALDDSHTHFIPPRWAAKIEFGWDLQVIGDEGYVIAVQPGSDAEAKGLKRGDLVLAVDGERPTRKNILTLRYEHRVLAPRASSELVVRSPGEQPRRFIVRTKVTEQKRVWTKSTDLADYIRELEDRAWFDRHRTVDLGEDLLIWRMPGFDLTREEIKRMLREIKGHRALILDLRGNGGGAVETLENMVAGFLENETKIGDVKSRQRLEPIVAKKMADVFPGRLIVLVDSDSGSASELFARTMQLAGRAQIIGDRSAGAVMMSRFYPRSIGSGNAMFYGSSITMADIIMTDGNSLERKGVTPDLVMLPTGEDLAAGRDPVLSHAASLCGVTLDTVKAGAFFPIEWKR